MKTQRVTVTTCNRLEMFESGGPPGPPVGHRAHLAAMTALDRDTRTDQIASRAPETVSEEISAPGQSIGLIRLSSRQEVGDVAPMSSLLRVTLVVSLGHSQAL